MLKVGDRVRICLGSHFSRLPSRLIGQGGIIIYLEPQECEFPMQIVHIDGEGEIDCYKDELELVLAGEEQEEAAERAQAKTLLNALDEIWGI